MAKIRGRCWCCNTEHWGVPYDQYCARCQSCTPELRACGATGASLNWPDLSQAMRTPIRHGGNYSPPIKDECPSCGAIAAEGERHLAPAVSA